ncbi:hypothetical protein [Insolitispirillum peregrinum]|uniref:Tail fiber protein n=1 Tax=Insolitispirillum peregrinum TaxID=80876 RepID=A0A1N7JKC8_9PROT|nr:hypothetical protein [Insolitispirillum peregrinum]SIS49822.1 hypothetical protein SAMN05421779_102353 [Insolitispirillum peregrinum]
MYYIDTTDAVTAAAKPTPPTAGSEKFFSDTPGSATVVPAWFLNMLQEELGNLVSAASLSHSKTDNSQLLKAVQALIASKTTGTLLASKNLSDVANVATARSNLGLATVASSGSYTDLNNKPALAAVATSGSYADLANKPDLTALPGYAKTTTGAKIEAFNIYGGDLNACNGTPGVVITECTTACTPLPAEMANTTGGLLIQFADSGGDDIRMQLLINATGTTMYQRIKWGGGISGTWSAWRNLSQTTYDIPFLAGWGAEMSGEDLAIRQYGGVVIARDVAIDPAAIITWCEVPPTGSAVIFDVRVNGTSIFSTLPTIPVGSSSNTAGTGTSTTISLSRFDRLTFHVTQVGSTVKGQKLYVCVKGTC